MLSPIAMRVVLSVILIIQMLGFCESIRKDDEGVCVENYVGFQDGYLTSMERLVCCSDYKYIPQFEKCWPLCNSECVNGTCVNATCICTPPLTLVNGTCVSPIGCEQGYMQSDGICVPICDYTCWNGKCTEPNKCECNPGYEVSPYNEFYCRPIPEYVTTVTDTSEISNESYVYTENTPDYKPTCDGCDDGQCVARHNCTCCEGYERINSTCMPKCSSCINGDCVLPGECRCHNGYVVSESGCIPVCSPPCDNGYCWAPNRCACNEGYYLQCSITCINEYCSAHNNCSCIASYQKYEEFGNSQQQSTSPRRETVLVTTRYYSNSRSTYDTPTTELHTSPSSTERYYYNTSPSTMSSTYDTPTTELHTSPSSTERYYYYTSPSTTSSTYPYWWK